MKNLPKAIKYPLAAAGIAFTLAAVNDFATATNRDKILSDIWDGTRKAHGLYYKCGTTCHSMPIYTYTKDRMYMMTMKMVKCIKQQLNNCKKKSMIKIFFI